MAARNNSALKMEDLNPAERDRVERKRAALQKRYEKAVSEEIDRLNHEYPDGYRYGVHDSHFKPVNLWISETIGYVQVLILVSRIKRRGEKRAPTFYWLFTPRSPYLRTDIMDALSDPDAMKNLRYPTETAGSRWRTSMRNLGALLMGDYESRNDGFRALVSVYKVIAEDIFREFWDTYAVDPFRPLSYRWRTWLCGRRI